MKRRLSLIVVGSVALLVGATLGPTVAQAASTGLVRLEGGGSSHVAKVTSSGQLSVTDGTAHTTAGQIESTVASPGQAVHVLGQMKCTSGGFYTVPTGKALIITTIVFYNHPTAAGQDEQDLTIGPAAGPCTANIIAAGVATSDLSLPQAFSPGIPVPAGDALGGFKSNESGSVEVYGYFVPAAAVPASRTAASTPLKSRGSQTIRP